MRGHEKLRTAKSRSGISAILGISGTPGIEDALTEWWVNGAKPSDCPKVKSDCTWNLLVVATGRVTLYTDAVPYPLQVTVPCATGSGADYAIGAMKAGASPRQAVAIACEMDTGCGEPIHVMDLVEMDLPKTKIAGINPRTNKQVIKLDRAS